MAKKKTPARRARSASPAELQRKILRLDQDVVRAISERAQLHQQLLEAKQQAGEPVYDAIEEQETLRAFVEGSKGPLDERCVRAIGRELLSGSRALAVRLRVAYLGPQYSYSHQAAVERFGQSVELVPVATIAAVFEELKRGHANFGLVPIENSTDGRIVDTLETFSRLPMKICGEVQLKIHHNLLSKCTRDQIHEVYSKPQALSQCRQWLARHLPHARTVEMTSTAAAAQLAADKQGAAAIASLQAATNYHLDVVASHIEDSKNNVTRFAVIGRGEDPPKKTRKDKTALMFEIAHEPGSLADVLAIFKRNRLNLTWIESFPIRDSVNEYLFFVELMGHLSEAKIKKAIESLSRKAVRLDVLGSYPVSEPIE